LHSDFVISVSHANKWSLYMKLQYITCLWYKLVRMITSVENSEGWKRDASNRIYNTEADRTLWHLALESVPAKLWVDWREVNWLYAWWCQWERVLYKKWLFFSLVVSGVSFCGNPGCLFWDDMVCL